MKYLFFLLFLIIFNISKVEENIEELLIKERIELYCDKSKIIYKISDKNDLITLYYVDSVQINLNINEIYCYYDFDNKKVITKDVYENTWFKFENKTNLMFFLMVTSEPETWEIKTDTIKCKKIKKNFNKKINYHYKIITSNGTIEYSNRKFDIDEILYYINSEGLVSELTYNEITNKIIKSHEK